MYDKWCKCSSKYDILCVIDYGSTCTYIPGVSKMFLDGEKFQNVDQSDFEEC